MNTVLGAITGNWLDIFNVVYEAGSKIYASVKDWFEKTLGTIVKTANDILGTWSPFWGTAVAETVTGVTNINTKVTTGLTETKNTFSTSGVLINSGWLSTFSTLGATTNAGNAVIHDSIVRGMAGNAGTVASEGGVMGTSWLSTFNQMNGITSAGMSATLSTVNTGMGGVVGAVSTHSSQMPPIYDSAWDRIQAISAARAASVKAAILASTAAAIAAAKKKYDDWNAICHTDSAVECDSCAVDSGGSTCSYDCASDNCSGDNSSCGSYSSDCWGGGGCDTAHAEGGIATKATRGTFGEAGPEALIPLPRYLKDLGEGKTTGSPNITININAPIYGIDDLNKAIDSALKQVQRNIKSMGG